MSNKKEEKAFGWISIDKAFSKTTSSDQWAARIITALTGSEYNFKRADTNLNIVQRDNNIYFYVIQKAAIYPSAYNYYKEKKDNGIFCVLSKAKNEAEINITPINFIEDEDEKAIFQEGNYVQGREYWQFNRFDDRFDDGFDGDHNINILSFTIKGTAKDAKIKYIHVSWENFKELTKKSNQEELKALLDGIKESNDNVSRERTNRFPILP